MEPPSPSFSNEPHNIKSRFLTPPTFDLLYSLVWLIGKTGPCHRITSPSIHQVFLPNEPILELVLLTFTSSTILVAFPIHCVLLSAPRAVSPRAHIVCLTHLNRVRSKSVGNLLLTFFRHIFFFCLLHCAVDT